MDVHLGPDVVGRWRLVQRSDLGVERPFEGTQAAGAPGANAPAALGGSPAAGQLLALLARPEIVQALMALMLGRAGTQTVNVGGTPVATGSVANLVSVLGQQAASESLMNAHGEAAYWGRASEDETAPEARAAEAFEAFVRSASDSDESEPETIFSLPESGYSFRREPEAVWP